jgi:hypothetical protein
LKIKENKILGKPTPFLNRQQFDAFYEKVAKANKYKNKLLKFSCGIIINNLNADE